MQRRDVQRRSGGSRLATMRHTRARRRVRSGLSVFASLALVLGLLPLSTAGLLLAGAEPAAAAPATLNVGNVEARVQKMSTIKPGAAGYPKYTGDCQLVSPGSGDYSSWVSPTGSEARTAHGRQGSRCPNSVDINTQSVIGVKPNNAGVVTEGQPFLLASFNHYNNPISGETRLYSSMDIRLSNLPGQPVLSFPWELWETPNNASPCGAGGSQPCQDQLSFDSDVSAVTVTINGDQYRLVTDGFVNQSGTCPATMTPGMTVQDTFLTAENATTHGCLYAHFTKVRELEVVKQVVLPSGATVQIPTFSYVTTTELAGSQWSPDFSLKPTATSPASVTREILSTEEVVIAETLPSDDRWSLKSITCVDQAGNAVPWENGNGVQISDNQVRINNIVGLTNTPTKITCTFTNEYTPRATLTLKKVVSGGTAVSANFTLTATGPSQISGPGNSAQVTNQRVLAGTYTLTESGPAAYELTNLTCTGATVVNNNGTRTINVADGANVTCTYTNTYRTGTLAVDKVISDPNGGYIGGNANFRGTVACTAPDGKTYTWTATQESDWTQANIPVGSVCSIVSEEAPAQSLLLNGSYSWENPQFSNAVTISQGTTAKLTVTNPIKQTFGYIQLSKIVQPAAGTTGAYTGGAQRTFPIAWSCSLGQQQMSGTVDLAAGKTSDVIKVPVGYTCSATEVKPTEQQGDFPDSSYFWLAPTISSPVVVAATNTQQQPAQLQVTNTYERRYGSIELAKTVSGPGASTLAPGTKFTLNYDCGGDFTGSRQVAPETPVTVSGLPLGAVCTVTENPVPTGSADLAAAYAWGTPTYSAANVVVKTTPDRLTVDNPTVAIFGQLSLVKKLEGDGASGVPNDAVFKVDVTCNAPAEGQQTNYAATFDLQANVAQTTPNLPVGTSCTVAEQAPTLDLGESYAWGTTPPAQQVQVGPSGSVTAVTVTNTINRVYGSLSITKSLTDPYGVVATGTTFSGTWSCTGNSTVSGTWSVVGSGGATMTGPANAILLGSTCTVTETLPAAPGEMYAWEVPVFTPSATVTVGGNTRNPSVQVSNSVKQVTSHLSFQKLVTGDVQGYVADSTFTLTGSCVDPADESQSIPINLTLIKDQTLALSQDVPIGWICTVSETGLPATSNADRYTWGTVQWSASPALNLSVNGTSVTFEVPEIAASSQQTIIATNPIQTHNSQLLITKTVTGQTDGLVAGSEFPINVDCGTDGPNGTYNVANGQTKTITVPAGITCTVTEGVRPELKDASFAWGQVTYQNGTNTTTEPIEVYIGQTSETVTVTNPIERVTAAVNLVKQVDDTYSVLATDRTYQGAWSCSYGGTEVASGNWGPVVAGTPVLLANDVPLTAVCTATETDPGAPVAGDPSYVWAPGNPTVTDATVVAGDTAQVVVTNTVQHQTGTITVQKTIDGDGYAGTQDDKDFTMILTCTRPGDPDGAQGTFSRTVSVAAGAGPVTISDVVPFGWNCTVSEAALNDNLLVDASYTWSGVTVTPEQVTLSNRTPSANVVVQNTTARTYGTFTVTKSLVGVPVSAVTDDFSGTWSCKYLNDAPVEGTWTVGAAGGEATLSSNNWPTSTPGQVLTGSVCTVAEGEKPDLIDGSWAWQAETISDDVTIAKGQTSNITVTNTAERVYAGFTITKSYTELAGALKPNAVVAGSWSCTYDSGVAGETAVTYDGRWTLPAAGGSVTITEDANGRKIPAESVCTVIEDTLTSDPNAEGFLLVDASYAWNAPTYSPQPDGANGAQVTLVAGRNPTATVTNSTYRVYGQLEITKVVDNNDLPSTADASIVYSGNYSCQYGSADPITGTWSTTAGGTFVAPDSIPVGAVCTVTENTPSGPVSGDGSYVWTSHTNDGPAIVPVGSAVATGGTAKVTVTNTMSRVTGSFAVTKAVVGVDLATVDNPDFEFSWECVPGDGKPDLEGTFTLAAGDIWNAPTTIPVGSVCTIEETRSTAGNPIYSWLDPDWNATNMGENPALTVDGMKVTFTLPAGTVAPLITATNEAVHNGWMLNKVSDPPSGTTVKPGQVITYTVTVTPTGGTVNGLVITDNLTDVVAWATIDPASINASQGTAQLLPPESGVTNLRWDIGTLTGTEPVTVTYQATVNDNAWSQVLRNHVTGQGDVPEVECPPGTTCTTSTEHPVPGYDLTKTSDPVDGTTVAPGSTVQYTLTAENTSTVAMSDLVVTDDLSDVIDDAVLTEPLAAGLTLAGTTLSWAIPTLQPGESASVSYEVTVDPTLTAATLRNVVTTGEDDGGTCIDCTTIHPVASLTTVANFERTYTWSITKSVIDTVDEVEPGTRIGFIYTVQAIPVGYIDGDYRMSGVIAVANPSQDSAVDVASLDIVNSDGWACALTEALPTIPAGGVVDLPYSCTFDGATPAATGVNIVTVTWGAGGPDQPSVFQSEYSFVLDTEVNRTVTVTDDVLGDGRPARVLGTATWTEALTPVVFTYTVTYIAPSVVGLYVVDNVAFIVETGQNAVAAADFTVWAPVLPIVPPTPPITPEPVTPERPVLPRTGADVMPLALLSLLGIGAGVGLLRVRRRIV
jgi:uncharacterized repeat protein (TIGR01451 family)